MARAPSESATERVHPDQGPLTVDEWQPAIGHLALDARTGCSAPAATYGDDATLTPPPSAARHLNHRARPARLSSRRAGSGEPDAGVRALPLGGGVLLDQDVAGNSGLGLSPGAVVHAAIGAWGRDGDPQRAGLTNHALIEVLRSVPATTPTMRPSAPCPRGEAGDAR